MKCPNCNETLLMSERNGVEIDYCPSCRGVWLDKGELDKMLDYADRKYQESGMQQGSHDSRHYEDRNYHDPYKKHDDYHKKHHRKKSFLGDIFDFD